MNNNSTLGDLAPFLATKTVFDVYRVRQKSSSESFCAVFSAIV